MAFKGKKEAAVLFLCLAASLIFKASALGLDKRLSYSITYYIMGVMQENLGNHALAVEHYRRALRADNENPAIRLSLATSLIKSDKITEAVKELKAVSKLDPQAVEPRALLALIYSSQDKQELASAEYEAALQNAVKLEPGNTEIYKNLGLVYLSQRKFKEAQNTYKLLLDLAPDDGQAHFYLGSVYEELKDRQSAVKEFEKALELNPDYHEALNSLGYLYVEEGANLDRALALIKKALEFEPDNGAYLDSLGWFYFKKGNLEKATEFLERASTLIDDPVVFDHLGDAHQKAGKIMQARTAWEKSLKLDPKLDKVKEKLERIK